MRAPSRFKNNKQRGSPETGKDPKKGAIMNDNTIHILLACGIGASSGFMAASMRRIAKKRGLDVKVNAASKSEVMDFADKIDILLLGPHFASEVPAYQAKLGTHGVRVMAINPTYYASLDGERILSDALDLYGRVYSPDPSSIDR